MGARIQPRWERVQRSKGAATYAGYPSEKAFLRAVSEGQMPPPFQHLGGDAWDIVDLDEAIDTLKAAGPRRKSKWQERAPDRV